MDHRLEWWENTDSYRGAALEAKRVRAACDQGGCSTVLMRWGPYYVRAKDLKWGNDHT